MKDYTELHYFLIEYVNRHTVVYASDLLDVGIKAFKVDPSHVSAAAWDLVDDGYFSYGADGQFQWAR